MVGICPAAEDQRHVGPPDCSGSPGVVLPCMALYCSGVMCSKPGGGTSQYRHARFFLLLLGEWLEGQLRWALFPRRQPCPPLTCASCGPGRSCGGRGSCARGCGSSSRGCGASLRGQQGSRSDSSSGSAPSLALRGRVLDINNHKSELFNHQLPPN